MKFNDCARSVRHL